MTNDIVKLREFKIPVLCCPNCGEKEPERVKLTECELTFDNNLQEEWFSGHGFPRRYSIHVTKIARIRGICNACGTSFRFEITAETPRRPELH